MNDPGLNDNRTNQMGARGVIAERPKDRTGSTSDGGGNPRARGMSVAAGALAVLAFAPAAAASPLRTSLAEAFFIQRHPVTGSVEWLGSGIIWFLMALSIACLGILGAMILENRRERIAPKALAEELPRLAGSGGGAGAVESRIANDPSLLAASAAAALEARHLGHDAMLHAAEDRLDELTVQRLRAIEPLSIVGNIAPMIGLFGTVYGMILAFREIVVSGGSPDPVGLAAGIGTALTTTFWGLIVAIPALAGHALIRNAIDARTFAALRVIERTIERMAGTAASTPAPMPPATSSASPTHAAPTE